MKGHRRNGSRFPALTGRKAPDAPRGRRNGGGEIMIEPGKKKKKRFAAKDGAVAAFVKPKNCHYTNLGQIVEMDVDGLSLKYLSREEGHLKGESVMLDIFGIGRPLLGAGKVECRVVRHSPDRSLFQFPQYPALHS